MNYVVVIILGNEKKVVLFHNHSKREIFQNLWLIVWKRVNKITHISIQRYYPDNMGFQVVY